MQLHGICHCEGFVLCVVQADHFKQFLRSEVNLGLDLMAAQNFFEVQEANEGGFHKSDIYKSYHDFSELVQQFHLIDALSMFVFIHLILHKCIKYRIK